MTSTETTAPTTETPMAPPDLYRDVHKGIRAELFAVTEAAGRTDPGDPAARADLAAHVRGVADALRYHAGHEDARVNPVLDEHHPELGARIAADHEALEARLDELVAVADAVAAASDVEEGRERGDRLYLDLAAYTSAYLAHQDVEEREVTPALLTAIGPVEVGAIHAAIVGSIPPDVHGRFMAFMLPAMNVEDRVEMLTGMQMSAPPEAFQGVWGLAGTVLDPAEHAALGARLGID